MIRLLREWRLTPANQLVLLGMERKSKSMLYRYAAGRTPLPDSIDINYRIQKLLSIYRLILVLYPQNPEIRKNWVHLRNGAFENYKPIENMLNRGMTGLYHVVRCLEEYAGQ